MLKAKSLEFGEERAEFASASPVAVYKLEQMTEPLWASFWRIRILFSLDSLCASNEIIYLKHLTQCLAHSSQTRTLKKVSYVTLHLVGKTIANWIYNLLIDFILIMHICTQPVSSHFLGKKIGLLHSQKLFHCLMTSFLVKSWVIS